MLESSRCRVRIAHVAFQIHVGLPAAIAKQMQLEEGAKVQLAIDGKRLVVQRIESLPDAKIFFAAVNASQSAHGLVRLAPGELRRHRCCSCVSIADDQLASTHG